MKRILKQKFVLEEKLGRQSIEIDVDTDETDSRMMFSIVHANYSQRATFYNEW